MVEQSLWVKAVWSVLETVVLGTTQLCSPVEGLKQMTALWISPETSLSEVTRLTESMVLELIFVVANSNLNFAGYNTFLDNSAKKFSGGITLAGSTLNLIGNTTFANNLVVEGGGIDALNSNLNFTRNSIFRGNSAERGGGISTGNNNLIYTGN